MVSLFLILFRRREVIAGLLSAAQSDSTPLAVFGSESPSSGSVFRDILPLIEQS
jgi:hypothetical protein